MGILGNVTRKWIQDQLTAALTTAATTADTKVATHNATDGAHSIYKSTTPPSGTSTSDYNLSGTLLLGPGGRIWLKEAGVAQVPQTPPVQPPAPLEQLGLGWTEYKAEFLPITSGVFVPTTTVTSLFLAKAMLMAVQQRDMTTFDALYTWGETHLKRGKTGSGQSTYLRAWATSASSAGVVSDYTVHTGAEVRVMEALIRAWNISNSTVHKDGASYKAQIIKQLTKLDEGRGYLLADSVTPHSSGGQEYWKIRMGDLNPVAFRMGFTFTGDQVFNQLVAGTYDLVTKMVGGSLATTTGLPPSYLGYASPNHTVAGITSGVTGWGVTLTTDTEDSGWDFIDNLIQDYNSFTEARALAYLSGALKTFLTGRWTAASQIVTRYTHAGAPVGTVETARVYWLTVSALKANDSGNATAAAIITAKTWADMGTNGFGKFIPNQIKLVAASSSADGNADAWLGYALHIGALNQLALYGNNPNAGTTNPGGATDPVVIPPGGTPVTGAYPLHVDSYSEIGVWANTLPAGTKKTRALWAAGQPMGRWIGDWDEAAVGTKAYIDEAAAAGKWAQVLSYRIPGRDLGSFSGGGAANRAAYELYIDNLKAAIGTRQVVMVYEPDSLSQADGLSADLRSGRISIMTAAIQELKAACPNLKLYVDIGHSAWHPAAKCAELLHEVQAERADGCALNVSSTRPDAEIIPFGQAVVTAFNYPGFKFIYDSGRNGNTIATEPWQWANPPNRRFGKTPQFGNTGITDCDGWMWWKRQGESDGNAGDGAPAAGVFWPTYMYNEAVGDNVTNSLVSNSSGMLQRPPTPGVAVSNPV